MRKFTLCLCGLLMLHLAFSQSVTVTGSIGDTTEHKSLSNAVISLLRPADSVLVVFTRSKEKGDFTLKNISPGSYLVMITYPKFADYVEQLKIGTTDTDLGKINLIRKSELLKEVVVTQKLGAIRMKGDTLAFMADSFKVKEGANVEDLLKKLPGIQVNKNGEITAQGEKVQKVLVDGEEFFSDDPAVVTQNMRADAVKEVQVFDKKSDQATFTGIDDGEKTKTINLKLKDDRKKGYFGKLKAGGGLPDKYENNGMLNAFKGKRKFAAFGTMSNTGAAGLNWEDQEKFGGGSNMQYDEDEGYFYSTGQSDEFNTWGGRYNGEGLPTAWTGGVHFSNKWNTDQNNLNLNYRYNKLNLGVIGSTRTQTITKDTQYFNNQLRNTYNQNIRNQFTGFYDMQLDSFTSLKFSFTGSRTTGRSDAHYISEALNEDSVIVNNNARDLSSIGTKQIFNSTLLLRKKFKKVGRTISFNMDEGYNENEMDGLLRSVTNFFDNGDTTRTEIIDQRKENRTKTFSFNSKVSYTEPLSKYTFLEMNVNYRVTNSESLKNSYNKEPGNDPKYTMKDSLFSNDYQFRVNTSGGGLNLRVNKKKFAYSFGGNISIADFRQTDLGNDSLYKYRYVNLNPRATFRYIFGPQSRLNLNYTGNTRQPTLEQIQPIRENTDPLNVQVGNPNLKQEFRHNLNFNYNNYKVLTSRSLWLSGNLTFTDNAISTNTIVQTNADSAGKRITQYVNVDGNYNMSTWMGYWFQLKKLKINLGVNGGANIGQYNNILDGEKNTNYNRSVNLYLNASYYKEKKVEIGIRPGATYTYTRSSQRPDVITRYWTSESNVEATVYLPWKLELSSEATFFLRQKTEVFKNTPNNTKWNAYLGKKFWKNNAGEIRMSVFDILDQNLGFQRNATSNFISENTYNTIRRYWLVSFIWNFSHNPAGTPTGGQ
jgi:hypothetical protein